MRQELAADLQLTGATDAEQVLNKLFKHAVEASIINLQNSMEAMCHNLQKQVGKRAAVAGVLCVQQELKVLLNIGYLHKDKKWHVAITSLGWCCCVSLRQPPC